MKTVSEIKARIQHLETILDRLNKVLKESRENYPDTDGDVGVYELGGNYKTDRISKISKSSITPAGWNTCRLDIWMKIDMIESEIQGLEWVLGEVKNEN